MARTYIAAAGNVEVPAYLTLSLRGFEVTCNGRGQWVATKEDLVFSAENPLQLLGIAAMFETRGRHWQANDNEIDAFFARFPE